MQRPGGLKEGDTRKRLTLATGRSDRGRAWGRSQITKGASLPLSLHFLDVFNELLNKKR